MSNIILQKTYAYHRKEIILYDDDTVEVDGAVASDAVVSEFEGVKRVSLKGNTVLDVNDQPTFSRYKVTRQPGWNDVLGWKVELLDLLPELSPGVHSIAVYSDFDAEGYLFTPGAFVFDEATQLWGAVCPPGHEPGDENIHFAALYASLPYSPFTLLKGTGSIEVDVGGDPEI